MRNGSLFTGYGGLDLAAEQHFDAHTVWCSDIDPGANLIIQHRMPDIPNHGDITTIDWKQVEPVDILTGGWPCQPFSHAGKRLGAADERALWPEVARAIRTLRPSYVVLENVAAIATAGELGRATANLAALGYVGQWRCLRAADIGAPHGRERIFIAAHAKDIRRSGGTYRPEYDPIRQVAASGHGLPAADTNGERHERLRSTWDGRQRPTDRSLAITYPTGDGRDEGWPEPTGQLRRPDATQCSTTTADDAPTDAAQPERGGTQPKHLGTPLRSATEPRERASEIAWGDYWPAINRWETILGRAAPNPTKPSRNGTRRLNPVFVEWMMGLPAGWITNVPELTRNQQLKALGNGVVPQQALAAIQLMSALTDRMTA